MYRTWLRCRAWTTIIMRRTGGASGSSHRGRSEPAQMRQEAKADRRFALKWFNEDELVRKWGRLGNEISFAGTSTIYKHFKGRLSRKRIEEVLSTIPTYSKYKEKRMPVIHNPIHLIPHVPMCPVFLQDQPIHIPFFHPMANEFFFIN